MPTVSYSENDFQPSFGYVEAQNVCESLNKKNYGWNVKFAFNRDCSFSTDAAIGFYDFQHAVSGELKDYFRGYTTSAMGAIAYTQGSDIHVAPGQESALAHEAWHVAQQK